MKTLTLGYLKGFTEERVKDHIVSEFGIDYEALQGFRILIAIEDGDVYDANSWYLLEKDGKLYENYASHCSCYGYENQWEPEETSLEYLKKLNDSIPEEAYEYIRGMK